MEKQKILNLLGMAQKSGKLISGDFASETHLRKTTAPLLFIASDGGNDNKKKYTFLAERQHIEHVDLFTKEELGAAIGKGQRVIVIVNDHGFAKALRKLLCDME